MTAVRGLVEEVDRERGTFGARLFHASKPDAVEWWATIRLRLLRPVQRRLVAPGAGFTIRRRRGIRMDTPRPMTAREIDAAAAAAEEMSRALRLLVWD